jgi:hypothetical protein
MFSWTDDTAREFGLSSLVDVFRVLVVPVMGFGLSHALALIPVRHPNGILVTLVTILVLHEASESVGIGFTS